MEMPRDMAEQWAKREAEHDAALRAEAQERAALMAVGNRATRRRLASKRK